MTGFVCIIHFHTHAALRKWNWARQRDKAYSIVAQKLQDTIWYGKKVSPVSAYRVQSSTFPNSGRRDAFSASAPGGTTARQHQCSTRASPQDRKTPSPWHNWGSLTLTFSSSYFHILSTTLFSIYLYQSFAEFFLWPAFCHLKGPSRYSHSTSH